MESFLQLIIYCGEEIITELLPEIHGFRRKCTCQTKQGTLTAGREFCKIADRKKQKTEKEK
jgi:hypothetical protein